MSYKPKFCCQCGEKVERINWRLWTNRRFCQLCETEYGLFDWIQKIAFVVLFLTAVIGIGNLWRKPEKELLITSNKLTANLPETNRNLAVQTNSSQSADSTTANFAAPNKDINSALPAKQTDVGLKQNEIGKQFEKQTAPEKVYFCGAQTKKGTPCSRRVKTAERCWQHTGQLAMLPKDKLIAGK